ncbi:DUF6624 domain-containing protein [Geothrix oryzisoli]|uniref:DUF6624 domain-containing protein n=1 Tax=Geothrix oryzisoli TaxID=2922721 RepID=UPI001FADDD9A|nr:DUF6624 domain-containing protein [Geothrix oryzisoli]
MILIPPAILQPHQDSIRTELEAMLESDQKGRQALIEIQRKSGPFSPEAFEVLKKQNLIDENNRRRLVEIINQSGWPKLSMVGEKAALAAFLVLQHASLDLQKQYLPIFRTAARSGESKLKWLALLEDRVLVGEGKKQLYGTQLIEKKGIKGIQVEPIAEEANVDERRAKMGLGPLADYLRGFGIDYRKPTKDAPNP